MKRPRPQRPFCDKPDYDLMIGKWIAIIGLMVFIYMFVDRSFDKVLTWLGL